MSTNGILDFQGTNKATFVGENSNVVIDTVNASFGIGVDVNGPTSNLHVVGNAYVTSNLEVGTANLFVDTSTSNVGIGTNAPGYTLDVVGDAAISSNLAVGTNKLFVDTVGGTVGIGSTVIDITDNTLSGAGNGLYIHNPVQGGHLLTLGTQRPWVFEQGLADASTKLCLRSLNSGKKFSIQSPDHSNVMTIVATDGGGAVGIGTDVPDNTLHISGTQGQLVQIQNTSDTARLVLNGSSGTGGDLIFKQAGTATWGIASIGDKLHFLGDDSTNQTRMTFDNNGNVGIGTANPQYRLDVGYGAGATAADDVMLRVMSASGTSGKLIFGRSGTTDIRSHAIETYNSSGANNNYMKFLVHDGTGTAPYETRTEVMTLRGDGNVGIGTTNPIAALDIDGGPENDTVPALSIRGGFYPESDLYVLNTYNVGSGVGYAAKVIGVNIKNKVETDNTIQIRSNTGGLTSAGAMYFGSDNYDQGVFGVLTGNGVPGTDLTERFRIDHVGKITSYHKAGFVVGNPNSGDGDDYAASTLDADWNAWVNIFNDAWIGGGNGWGTFWAGSSGARYRKDTNDTNPNEYVFVGGGNKRFTFELNNGAAYFDGTLSQSNYDYAEYFEWEDGNLDNEDRRGYSVVLRTDGKIMKATSDDEPTNIIGIVSGTSSIVGDAAGYDWHGKYEVDEWGTKVTDEVYQLTWTEDGENHSYDEDRVPEGITVPESGVSRRLHNRERIAPGYDDTVVYIPRDKRKEWCTVGLLGKVRLRDGCPTNPNWRYMKTIAGKELWLIR